MPFHIKLIQKTGSPWDWDSNKAENILKDRLNINSLSHLGFEKPTILRSVNALLTYIERNIGQSFKHIKTLIFTADQTFRY